MCPHCGTAHGDQVVDVAHCPVCGGAMSGSSLTPSPNSTVPEPSPASDSPPDDEERRDGMTDSFLRLKENLQTIVAQGDAGHDSIESSRAEPDDSGHETARETEPIDQTVDLGQLSEADRAKITGIWSGTFTNRQRPG